MSGKGWPSDGPLAMPRWDSRWWAKADEGSLLGEARSLGLRVSPRGSLVSADRPSWWDGLDYEGEC